MTGARFTTKWSDAQLRNNLIASFTTPLLQTKKGIYVYVFQWIVSQWQTEINKNPKKQLIEQKVLDWHKWRRRHETEVSKSAGFVKKRRSSK